MSRLRSLPVWAKVAFVALLVVSASACDEGGEKLPTRCSDTDGDGVVDPLPLDDLGSAGSPHASNPCVTELGHAVSFVTNGGSTTTTAGTSSGGNQTGQGGADAGAGGS
ncbi:MAG TPA: hypothetical protein VJN18_29230 [Polyangiaceae bacterium]|nr:hypothetical protein [Polyangiaceae bacterium]